MKTNNPVFDAERHEQTDQDFILCDLCEQPIYREDSFYNGDMVYEINGLSVCEDCIGDYIRSLGKELS